MNTGTYPVGTQPKGYQQLTVSTTAVPLVVPQGAVRAVIGVEAQPIRYKTSGTPTADEGFLVKADVTIEIYGGKALKDFLAIRDGGTDGILNINYYGEE